MILNISIYMYITITIKVRGYLLSQGMEYKHYYQLLIFTEVLDVYQYSMFILPWVHGNNHSFKKSLLCYMTWDNTLYILLWYNLMKINQSSVFPIFPQYHCVPSW